MDQTTRDHYLDTSNRNISLHQESIMNAYGVINKIIFYIGTGTFVLSLSFIGSLKGEVFRPWVLIFSWICMLVAITGNFFAHLITAKMAFRSIELLNKERSDGFPSAPDYEDKIVKKDTKLNLLIKWTTFVNILVPLFLFMGLVSVVYFGSVNLLNQNNANSEEKAKQEATDKLKEDLIIE